MKKLLILSDTHGNLDAIDKLKCIMKGADYIIHLGDYYRDMDYYEEEFGDKIYRVKGNCDGGGKEIELRIEGLKVLALHGDRYGVKYSLTNLKLFAKEQKADVVLFGHTHYPTIEKEDGIIFINPGNMTKYSNPSYCFAIINGDRITAKTVYLYE